MHPPFLKGHTRPTHPPTHPPMKSRAWSSTTDRLSGLAMLSVAHVFFSSDVSGLGVPHSRASMRVALRGGEGGCSQLGGG